MTNQVKICALMMKSLLQVSSLKYAKIRTVLSFIQFVNRAKVIAVNFLLHLSMIAGERKLEAVGCSSPPATLESTQDSNLGTASRLKRKKLSLSDDKVKKERKSTSFVFSIPSLASGECFDRSSYVY